MAIRGVLFDLDQTLWRVEAPPDFDEVTRLQCAEIAPDCARLGLGSLDLDDFVRRFWENFGEANRTPDGSLRPRWVPAEEVIRKMISDCGVDCAPGNAACLWEALNRVSARHFNVRLFPDAIAAVGALEGAGYRMAVVTDRYGTAAAIARDLREQGLPEAFGKIFTTGEIGVRKPHTLVFECALDWLGARPDEVIVVGDSYEHDIVPAAKLGMVPVLKLNDREPDAGWVLAQYQVPSLAALLELEILIRRPA